MSILKARISKAAGGVLSAAAALVCLMAAGETAHAQVRALGGTYVTTGGSGDQMLVHGVPWNDGESISVIFLQKEISAFRSNTRSPFVYNQAGCVVTFSPYRDRGRQAFAVQTSGMCTGQNAHLAAINGNFVRRR